MRTTDKRNNVTGDRIYKRVMRTAKKEPIENEPQDEIEKWVRDLFGETIKETMGGYDE